jgi:hypothetical protein
LVPRLAPHSLVRLVGALVVLATLLHWALPHPLEAAPAGPTGPVVTALGLAAWALCCYLALVLALTALTQVRGCARCAGVLLSGLAPTAVRRVAAGLLGVGLLLGGTGTAGATEPVRPPATSDAAGYDWRPGVQPPVASVPAVPPTATPSAPTRSTPAPPPETVTVRPGDTLWELAAAELPGADARAVARAWPSWWTANRAVIGDDPDLLHPGQQLVRPSQATG